MYCVANACEAAPLIVSAPVVSTTTVAAPSGVTVRITPINFPPTLAAVGKVHTCVPAPIKTYSPAAGLDVPPTMGLGEYTVYPATPDVAANLLYLEL